jgi:putative membrane protein
MTDHEPSADESAGEPGWRRVFTHDVRATGREPDVRFSLANERTFLAWVRTALALVGGGFAIEKLVPELAGSTLLAVGLMFLGLLLAILSYRRWVLSELALRTDRPLPASRLPLFLVAGVVLAGCMATVLVLVDGS